MNAIEFEAESSSGIIEIPKNHKEWFNRRVKVILLTEFESKTKEEDKDELEFLSFFNRFNADLTDYRFDREEANER